MAGVNAGRLNIEIVAEIARLQQDLDKAKRAVNAASKDIAQSARHANDNLAGMGRGALKAGQNSRLASHHMMNMGFQIQDITQGLLTGQRPMTVFIQQGGQIAGIMAQAGLGVGGLAKEVGRMGVNFARAHPVLVGLGVAAGGATIGIRSLTSEMTEQGNIDEFVAGLGLTKDELEKLEGQAVTATDVFKGLWKTLLDVTTLDEKIAVFWNKLKEMAGDAFDAILTANKYMAAGIYAGFKGSVEAAGILYRQLPRVIGEGVIAAANFVIRTLEQMANRAIGILNKIIEGVNGSFIGEFFGGLPKMAEVSFGRIENSFAGSASRMSADLSGVFGAAFDEGLAGMDSFMAAARENILQATRDRLMAAAAELIADRDEKAGKKNRVKKAKKEIDEYAKALKAAMEASKDFRDGLAREMMQAELTQIQLRRLEGATQILALEKLAFLAPTEQVRQALLAEADALQRDLDMWEAWYRGRANKSFETDILKPLRDEIALHGLVGTARERASLLQEKKAFLLEREAAGVEDVNGAWAEYLSLHEQIWAQQDAMAQWQERYGRVQDFLNDINKTPDQMAAAFDDIKINGLDAFNEGLVDAMVNFRSLGDVAQQIIRQILADLLRLQIQQAIIGPLASALGLSAGAGVPVNLLSGTPFGGGAASGREHVSPGTAYTIGENGPEKFIPTVPGKIVANGANDNSGTWNVNVTVAGAMTDRQARETGGQIGRSIKRQLNGR